MKYPKALSKANYLLYFVASALVTIGVFMWIRQDQNTNEKASSTGVRVEDIEKAVDDLKADHDGQDALLTCLFNILAQQDRITRVQVEGCVIETAVPKTSGGTAPSGQGGGTSQPQGSQTSPSPSQPTAPSNPAPSNPPPTAPPPPDNDGVIINLPILPPVHIPSPL